MNPLIHQKFAPIVLLIAGVIAVKIERRPLVDPVLESIGVFSSILGITWFILGYVVVFTMHLWKKSKDFRDYASK